MCSEWTKKNGTLSHKNAQKEFGLTEDEIIDELRSGRMQFKVNYAHGNPYYRLLRSEVEAYVTGKYGDGHLKRKQYQNELSKINSELRKIKSRQKKLQARKDELKAILEA